MLLAPADPLFLITCMIYQSWSNLKPTNRKKKPVFVLTNFFCNSKTRYSVGRLLSNYSYAFFLHVRFLKRFSFFYYVSVLTS